MEKYSTAEIVALTLGVLQDIKDDVITFGNLPGEEGKVQKSLLAIIEEAAKKVKTGNLTQKEVGEILTNLEKQLTELGKGLEGKIINT